MPAQGSTEATQDFVLEGEALDVQISHYTCVEENYGGTHYCPWGSPMASSLPVHAGAVACDPSWMERKLLIGGIWLVECEDTGSLVKAPIVDWWCWSFDHYGAPGSPEYDQRCPAICEWQDEAGRCWAKARVVE